MKKIALIMFLFVSGAYSQSLSKLYKEVKNSVVSIDIVKYDYTRVIKGRGIAAESSIGSGVLVSEDGLIWTAEHVISSAEEIKVEFSNGERFNAEVIKSDTNVDIALIKIIGDFNLKDKRVAKIGESDKLEIGEDIFVIGAPFGFKQTLSRGILSGRYLPKQLNNNFQKIEYLQSDAAINPGNSGGPIFNMKGEVVGIASWILSKSGGFNGVSFGISSNVVKEVLNNKNEDWAGIESLFLTKEMSRILNVPQKSGVLITKVSSKGTAFKIGLKGGFVPAKIGGVDILLGGDVILEIAGIRLEDRNALVELDKKMKSINVGESFEIIILRQGGISKRSVTKE